MVVGHTVSWSVLGVGVGIGSAHAKLETGRSDQELARALQGRLAVIISCGNSAIRGQITNRRARGLQPRLSVLQRSRPVAPHVSRDSAPPGLTREHSLARLSFA